MLKWMVGNHLATGPLSDLEPQDPPHTRHSCTVRQLKLQERLQNLKMEASLATFLNNPGSLDSVLAVANSVKDSPLAEQMKRHALEHPQFCVLVKEGR